MQNINVDVLSGFQALKEVPVDQLEWLLENSHYSEAEEGSFLFKLGETIPATYFIIEGGARAYVPQTKGEVTLRVFGPGDITGYLPFSRGIVAPAHMQVTEKSLIVIFPKEKIKDLILHHYELAQALVHVMTSRVRDLTALQQQNEKMMALGKLSAGLAHELNNPAAAIVRGSTLLQSHLRLQPETFKKVMAIKTEPATVDKVNQLLFDVLAKKDKPILSMKKRMELEDELQTCMDDLQVENSAEIAENMVEFGFTCGDVEKIVSLTGKQDCSPVLNWINNNLVTEKMVLDIREASQRIEKLVSSVKIFTHMDRDHDKQFTNIHQGITNTLNMLDFKRRKAAVELVEHYETNLPEVKAYVGELNQVWTNLVDNAYDAMEVNGKGVLEIVTRQEKNNVIVNFTDNGPGISDDIKSKIFDPFFTTKEIGKGTGLGLDVVNRIVKQHNGTVTVQSVPGRTTFSVCFPING